LEEDTKVVSESVRHVVEYYSSEDFPFCENTMIIGELEKNLINISSGRNTEFSDLHPII